MCRPLSSPQKSVGHFPSLNYSANFQPKVSENLRFPPVGHTPGVIRLVRSVGLQQHYQCVFCSWLLHFLFRDACLEGLQYVLEFCHPENRFYCPVPCTSHVPLNFYPLPPEDGVFLEDMLEGFVFLFAEPTKRSILGDYYAFHVVQIAVSCNCVCKKCHVFPTEPGNYLPYPTILSMVEYFRDPILFQGHPFFFPFVVDILCGSCLNFFACVKYRN